MVFYLFNVAVIVGLGFFVFCLRCFARDVNFESARRRKSFQPPELRLTVRKFQIRDVPSKADPRPSRRCA